MKYLINTILLKKHASQKKELKEENEARADI
jgi:hypothetical protein